MGGANLVTGVLLTLYIFRYSLKFNLKFKLYLKQIIIELNEGKEVFFSNFSIGIYLSANVLILSLFVSPFVVGLYGIAEKIMMLLRTLLGVFVQATYPYVCKLVHKSSFKDVVRQVLRITIPFIVGLILLCVILAYSNFYIASFFNNGNINELALLIRKLSFLPFLVSLNIVPNLIILAYNKEKIKSYILLFSTGLSLVLSFSLVPYFKENGTITIMYFIELGVAITSVYYMLTLDKQNTASYKF